jgi:hypothetical protein
MACRAAAGATAGKCLLTAADVLRARSLALSPTWHAGAFERLLTAFPGDAYYQQISRHLGAALPRLPWVAGALLDWPDKSMSDEDATADLLSSHCMGSGVAAITQNNLKVLEGKAIFGGKQSQAATEMLNRTGALALSFAAYVARRVVESCVCGAGPQLDAVLSDAFVRSFLDGNLFLNFKSLCTPLVRLEARPYAKFAQLAAHGGIPSHETVVHMYEAYDELFDDLG